LIVQAAFILHAKCVQTTLPARDSVRVPMLFEVSASKWQAGFVDVAKNTDA